MKYRYKDVEYDDFLSLKPVLAKEVGVDVNTPHGVHGRTFGEVHPVPGSGYILFQPDGGWTLGGSPHQFEYARDDDGVRVRDPRPGVKQFNSLGGFALHLLELEVGIMESLHLGLVKVAKRVEKDAKAEVGTYQAGVGEFPGWPELAEATKDDRVRKGYSENDPLLRSGQRRDDITHEVDHLEAVVGTPESAPTAQIAVYEEFGTSKEPARPVLGPAAFKNKSTIEKLVGAALVAGIIGQDQIHAALGYDFETRD